MRIGMRSPLREIIWAVAFNTGFPLDIVRLRTQAFSQMLARKTSQHLCPRASRRFT